MKILIINELMVMGGTEVQTFREQDIFASHGHDVYVLTFDPNKQKMTKGHRINYPLKLNLLQKFLLRTVGNHKYNTKIKKIIDNISPNVIHINNIINLPFEIMYCVKDIPTVQTIRDYSAICPKGTCIYEDNSICSGYIYGNCIKCIGLSPKNLFKLKFIKKYNAARLKSVNLFISPSKALADTCTFNGLSTKCMNNPFDFSKVSEYKKNKGNKKIYFYYGLIADFKGINILFKVFSTFAKESEVELWIAGKIEPSYEKKFKQLLGKADYAKYLGIKQYAEIMKLYKDVYCVIVPSLWIENYPNTVLEALANKTLVIGSNRGGIPELIQNDELCFDIMNESSFLKCLEKSLYISESEYANIVQNGFNRVKINNSPDKYYERLMNIYGMLLNISKIDN